MSFQSTKQMAAKVSILSVTTDPRIPYTIVPFTDGTNPPPELPEIRQYSDILALSADQTAAYLQGYGGHVNGSNFELHQRLGNLLGARVVAGTFL
ncbi:hypothetical protein BS47DRAFT_1352555 [Hydnum rufescens UP504]|uniref:Mug135-like C-terminal domain-containing protein n=1 Tax=Hydnum rufescens UP504 TaxID=1448309 RepID=A0A9P6DPT8_9AGAM|nr:hypothetical protein BS47DRAFT_1352555 [Hydnum rufescens UP504]